MKRLCRFILPLFLVLTSIFIIACYSTNSPNMIIVNQTKQSTSSSVSQPLQNTSLTSTSQEQPVQDVSFITEDNVKIAATYYRAQGTLTNITHKAVILVHMLGKDRSTWEEFAEALQGAGLSVLAIDLRGHGESDLDWNTFSVADWKKGVLDIRGAVNFLGGKGFSISNIYFAGASIGANLVLSYASLHDEVEKIVLLSPGLNYRGVDIEDAYKHYEGKVVYVVSQGDSYSYDSVVQLAREPSQRKILKLYEGKAHGTDLFAQNPELVPALLVFFGS